MTSGEEIIKIQLELLSEYAKMIIGSLEDNNAILKKILDSAQNISWKSNIIADKITEDDTILKKILDSAQNISQNISWKSNIIADKITEDDTQIADKITEDDTQHPKGIVGGQSVDPLRTGVTIINPYI